MQTLQDVDFELLPGEVHVLLGENGAGKSTLIKLLSGVYSKDSGRFVIGDREVEINSVHESQKLGISTIYQGDESDPGVHRGAKYIPGQRTSEKLRPGVLGGPKGNGEQEQ